MMLIEETTVPQGALPVADFKEHLRLGTGFSGDALQDGVLESYLRAAMAAIEARTGKILIEREFTWTLTFWRERDRQVLPVAPISAISGITLVDAAGGQTALPNDAWHFEHDMARPSIRAAGAHLPAIPAGGFARLGFLAGFGPDWTDLPADLAQAVRLLAAHYYEYRHDSAPGARGLPYSVNALLERYRSVRLTGGGRA
ncbi:hypothetical protein OG2516_04269 [Oceanicola granulosus HTCC2516]|uniref:PhiE125 gp8 family phage protein n=1 Tax=Oceanicola granulosus (strain ATCC BAA-861 / DSM 15982 / KCTC 12143 / HTCC2516) TaxID=314256 RepID=Q2CEB5_OCEGH|nr:head-tail connector protein [Oceanicola granulosus]EAR51082.1 hypothetical protein OG2516_04269 [Oceanicola granulosus HTCC2516]